MLDLNFVRRHFPTLQEGWTLFDNAGGSVPARGVIDAVAEFLTRWPVQLGASYALSQEAGTRVAAGHRAMETWIGAPEGSVILGPSTTVNMKLLAAALRPLWKEGDEVVVTNVDHEANIGCWRKLEATGIRIKEWKLRPESLRLELEDLQELLTERTRLVACTHCSNILGEIVDVAEVARRAHDAGALVCVDGVAYAPHRRPRVTEWDVDFYGFSLYKTYGPHQAVLYGKREHLLAARGQNHFFHGEDQLPAKLEPGNANHELTASLPQILAYFEELAAHHDLGHGEGGLTAVSELFAEHEERLATPLLDFLRARPGVRIVGPETADRSTRVPTISFTVEGRKASEIPPKVDEHHIAIRWGHFYAYRLIEALGLMEQDGIVRVSMVHYNTPEEVHRLVDVLDEIL
ncbi:MAG: aminotransferase class V-fold PLP-dependent enzyme [Acidobacteriota bacterium]|nr:aminotransferase class V-fold PLP-dependent enzyme [Acidobacteriota bacterium]